MKEAIELLERRKVGLQQEARKNQDTKDRIFSLIGDIDSEIYNREQELIKSDSGVSAYESGDYCGMSSGRYAFYYGYEAQMCLKHDDCTCEDKEWCFTASIDDEEVMRIPKSKLGQKTRTLNLIHGIGQFLSREVSENADQSGA